MPCGAAHGKAASTSWPHSGPWSLMEAIAADSWACFSVSCGSIVGRRDASIDLPVPGGPSIKQVMRARRRDFKGSFDMILPMDIGKIYIGFWAQVG